MERGRRRVFLGNGLLLAAGQTGLRLFSLAFQAYLTALAGAEAMGLFALAQSVNALAATFATSGLSLAVTRLCAREPQRGRQILFRAMGMALVLGGAVAAALCALSGPAAARGVGDARVAPALRLFSLALPVMAVGSCLHGCLLARRRVGATVGLHVLETAVCALVTAGLLRAGPPDPQRACLSLTAGSVAGEAAGVLCALALCRDMTPGPAQHAPVVRPLWHIAAPVAAGAYVRAALRTAENLMIPAGLMRSGLTHAQALSRYGVYRAMGLPAVMFPSGVVGAYATLLVPELSGGGRRIRMGPILALTLYYACLCGGFLAFYAPAVAGLLGGGAELTQMLPLLAVLAPIWYLDTVVDAAVNALDGQRYALKYNAAESVLRLAMMTALIGRWGMAGYILTVVCCSGGNLWCSVRCLARLGGEPLRLRALALWGAAGLACAAAARALAVLSGRTGLGAGLLWTLALGLIGAIPFLRPVFAEKE